MADIARESGLTRQAVYLHFGNRTELLVQAVRHADAKLDVDSRLDCYRRRRSGLEGLRAFIEFWGSYIPEIYGIARALRLSKEKDEAAQAAWDDRMSAVRGLCLEITTELSREGSLLGEWSTEQAADALWALLSIANWEQLTQQRGWSNEQYIEAMRRMAFASFTKGTRGVAL